MVPWLIHSAAFLVRYAMTIMAIHWFSDYFYTITFTQGPSMLPTIPHSDGPWYRNALILISRSFKHGKGVKVGDIVIYSHPLKPGSTSCKRIIGMPGDLVCVVTPGKWGDEEIDNKDSSELGAYKEEMIRVPEGHCWLVGDNLTWSRDSRVHGPVPLNLVKGKVTALLWPMDQAKWLGGRQLTDAKEEEHEWLALR
jgi:inner membrane protease subunit 1